MQSKRQQLPTEIRPIEAKATPQDDDDADRDELGVISDAQVEKDIEQLRRQQAEEESEVVLYSPNGHRDDDWGKSLYKSLTGIHVDIREFDA